MAQATIKLLNPWVRILLHYGVSHSEFAELAKRSFVEVANRYFSIPNRKKTHSRVAVLTGLSRKDVVRLSGLEADEPPVTGSPLNRATRVIGGWIGEPDFLDEVGNPRSLPLLEGSPSFEELVERYSGDITARAVLDELVRVGAAVKPDKGHVQLISQGYIPSRDEAEKIDMMPDTRRSARYRRIQH